jgi:hypothetical protein
MTRYQEHVKIIRRHSMESDESCRDLLWNLFRACASFMSHDMLGYSIRTAAALKKKIAHVPITAASVLVAS